MHILYQAFSVVPPGRRQPAAHALHSTRTHTQTCTVPGAGAMPVAGTGGTSM